MLATRSEQASARLAPRTTPHVDAALYSAAWSLHKVGFNIALVGKDKAARHKWRVWTDVRQERRDINNLLPWGDRLVKGIALICGIGGARFFDLDKCDDPQVLARLVSALGLHADYPFQYRSGHGYGILVRCHEKPAGMSNVLVGMPRAGMGFKQLELRYSDCYQIVPPSRHASGHAYSWLHGDPFAMDLFAEPATVTHDALMAAFLTIAEPHVSAPAARPVATVEATRTLAPVQQSGDSLIARFNLENDLGDVLARNGCLLMASQRGSRYYSGLQGEHTHRVTYVVSPARRGGWIGYSYSTHGRLNKCDYPRGFDSYTAARVLEGKTFKDIVAAGHAGHVPDHMTTAAIERRKKDRDRKRAERQAEQNQRREAQAYQTARIINDPSARETARRAWAIHTTYFGTVAQHYVSVARMAADLCGVETAEEVHVQKMQRANTWLIEHGYLIRSERRDRWDGTKQHTNSWTPAPQKTAMDAYRVSLPFSTHQEAIKKQSDTLVDHEKSPMLKPDLACEGGGDSGIARESNFESQIESEPTRESGFDSWEWQEDQHGPDELALLLAESESQVESQVVEVESTAIPLQVAQPDVEYMEAYSQSDEYRKHTPLTSNGFDMEEGLRIYAITNKSKPQEATGAPESARAVKDTTSQSRHIPAASPDAASPAQDSNPNQIVAPWLYRGRSVPAPAPAVDLPDLPIERQIGAIELCRALGTDTAYTQRAHQEYHALLQAIKIKTGEHHETDDTEGRTNRN